MSYHGADGSDKGGKSMASVIERAIETKDRLTKALASFREDRRRCIDARTEATADLRAQLERVSEALVKTREPYEATERSIDKDISETEASIRALELVITKDKFEHLGVNDVKEFIAWVMNGVGADTIKDIDFPSRVCSGPAEAFVIKDTTGLPVFRVFRMTHWNDKFQVAFEGAKVRGWLKVEPSRHPGDWTTAWGEVDGKPFLTMKFPRPAKDFGYEMLKAEAEARLGAAQIEYDVDYRVTAGSVSPCEKPVLQFRTALTQLAVDEGHDIPVKVKADKEVV